MIYKEWSLLDIMSDLPPLDHAVIHRTFLELWPKYSVDKDQNTGLLGETIHDAMGRGLQVLFSNVTVLDEDYDDLLGKDMALVRHRGRTFFTDISGTKFPEKTLFDKVRSYGFSDQHSTQFLDIASEFGSVTGVRLFGKDSKGGAVLGVQSTSHEPGIYFKTVTANSVARAYKHMDLVQKTKIARHFSLRSPFSFELAKEKGLIQKGILVTHGEESYRAPSKISVKLINQAWREAIKGTPWRREDSAFAEKYAAAAVHTEMQVHLQDELYQDIGRQLVLTPDQLESRVPSDEQSRFSANFRTLFSQYSKIHGILEKISGPLVVGNYDSTYDNIFHHSDEKDLGVEFFTLGDDEYVGAIPLAFALGPMPFENLYSSVVDYLVAQRTIAEHFGLEVYQVNDFQLTRESAAAGFQMAFLKACHRAKSGGDPTPYLKHASTCNYWVDWIDDNVTSI